MYYLNFNNYLFILVYLWWYLLFGNKKIIIYFLLIIIIANRCQVQLQSVVRLSFLLYFYQFCDKLIIGSVCVINITVTVIINVINANEVLRFSVSCNIFHILI